MAGQTKAEARASALANPAFVENIARVAWRKGQASPNPTGRLGKDPKLRVNEPPFTHLRKQKFLAQYRRKPNLTEAAKWAGVSRGTVERTRQEDREFDELIKEIQLEHSDAVEAEMFRRAIEGDQEPMQAFGKLLKDENGNQIYRARYDQRAAEKLLERYKPEFRAAQRGTTEGLGVKQPIELKNARDTLNAEIDRIRERLARGKTRAIAARRAGSASDEAEPE